MDFRNSRSIPSTLVKTNQGQKPLIERTEGEKIRIATKYLEQHGYHVLTRFITRSDIANILGVSMQHVVNLSECDDFPKPIDIGGTRRNITSRITARWLVKDFESWIAGRKL